MHFNAYYQHLAAQNVRNINKRVILSSIQFTSGGISRAELARQLGLTRSAVTTIINDLMEKGVVQETDKKTGTSGRPRTLLTISPDAGYVVGIDIGATHLRIALSDFVAQVIVEKEIPLQVNWGPETCIQETDNLLRELLTEADISLLELSGVGFGVPGPVSSDAGMVIAPPIMPGWDGYPIRKMLEELWGLPVSVNNDAELGALGEWAYGAGRESSDLAYIKVGSGVGAGLLIGGHIYQGSTGSAGEIGHLTVDNKGPLCSCGNRGCLETLSGGHAIARIAKNAIKNKENTQLKELPLKQITAKDVALAAQRGDLLSQRIIEEAGQHLGVAIAGLVNVFNPDMVVVGGGIAQIGDLFIEPIRKTVEERSLLAATTKMRITTALLGRRSSSMGAIAQALNIALHTITENR